MLFEIGLFEFFIGFYIGLKLDFRKRNHDVFNEGHAYEYKLGKKTKVIHKTVQCWIKDVEFNVTSDEDLSIQHVNHSIALKLQYITDAI